MGLRGPKPVDKECLTFRAAQFANFLFTLRDGQPARIKASGPTGSLEAAIAGPVSEELLRTLQKLSGTPYELIPPIPPNPAAWEEFKSARTDEEICQAAERIRGWARHVKRREWKTEFPNILCRHAADLVHVKKAWNYPKDLRRATSDDKRVFFFAKTLAGLSFELSPMYVAKLFTYWPYDRQWIQGPFVAMEKSFGGRIADLGQKRTNKKAKGTVDKQSLNNLKSGK